MEGEEFHFSPPPPERLALQRFYKHFEFCKADRYEMGIRKHINGMHVVHATRRKARVAALLVGASMILGSCWHEFKGKAGSSASARGGRLSLRFPTSAGGVGAEDPREELKRLRSDNERLRAALQRHSTNQPTNQPTN